jgi:hypothetical protein
MGRAQEPGGVFPIPADVAYLQLRRPDTGLTLQTGPSVTGPWTTPFTPRLVGVRDKLCWSTNPRSPALLGRILPVEEVTAIGRA